MKDRVDVVRELVDLTFRIDAMAETILNDISLTPSCFSRVVVTGYHDHVGLFSLKAWSPVGLM